VGWIASVTVGQAEEAPGGALSRDSFYWYGGATQCITAIDTTAKSIDLQVDGPFADALNAVAADVG